MAGSAPSDGTIYDAEFDDIPGQTTRETSVAVLSEPDAEEDEHDSEYYPPFGSLDEDDIEEILEYSEMIGTGDDDDDEDDDYVDNDDDDDDTEFQEAFEEQDGGDNLRDIIGSDTIFRITRSSMPNVEDGDANEENEDDNTPREMHLTGSQFFRLVGDAGLSQVLAQFRRGRIGHIDVDDDIASRYRSRRRARRSVVPFPKVPSDEGRDLMESGNFGTNERDLGSFERKKTLANRLMKRELGIDPRGRQKVENRIASQNLIPSSRADKIIHYDSRCYSGQFSDDGNFFFSCAQDFLVRMYDTSNPYNWRYYRTVRYPYGQWTITDASLSPDNKFLAYSSIRSVVCLAATDPDQEGEPYNLDFSDMGRRDRRAYHDGNFGIWSIRFSGDGREIVAGTSDNSVYVYDIETRQSILRIRGHDDHVNAVCFGDKSSPHLLYSGSDDSTLKVWDRRSLQDQREAGVFLGHTEGLTFVDSKGDGRYVLSNGKDQTMKLWDLRKMISTEKAEKVDINEYLSGFDYRFQDYNEYEYRPHPHDCSLVTFRGHKVLKTLIRCHFSPPGSTDSRYVYSGSEDGSVYIYNLDATLAGKIDVQKATHNSRPRGNVDDTFSMYETSGRLGWKTCVRDASWHPYAPVIAATSWNGYDSNKGTCTTHTWNDGLEEDEAEPHMGHSVNSQLQDDRRLHESASRTDYTTRQQMLRALQRARRDDDDS